MKRRLLAAVCFLMCCRLWAQTAPAEPDNRALAAFFDNYYEGWLRLFPIQATYVGDNRYNDLLFADFTDSYRARLKAYYVQQLDDLKKFNSKTLNASDQLSYDILTYNLNQAIKGLAQPDNLMPANQFISVPQVIGQMGSGVVVQPFQTLTDYSNWIRRATAFSVWVDSAIVYFRKGMAAGVVLPRALVVKMIPQLEALATTDTAKSVFYGPIRRFPSGFSEKDKKEFVQAYQKLIREQLGPAYQKLAAFLQTEYLPKARTTSGVGALPGGDKWYRYQIRALTTTQKTPDELFNTGLAEVKRIRAEMEKVKAQMGFKGNLKAFLAYTRTDPAFFPYKTPEEVLAAYRKIQGQVEPHLPKLFNHQPQTPFEIRQVEAFRVASMGVASYLPGSLENDRPGIFYVPVIDATQTPVDECVFIHEAIPGHHFQIMLQRENKSLPRFQRYGLSGAYVEGWGLYTESLGKELGCYTEPRQYLKALTWDIHRAIRLVVDVGMHAKGWSREKAIRYMMDNEPVSEQVATAEIERYMAWPAQALTYKVGALKIQELRKKYARQLGAAFNLAAFHDELLKDGAMPLDVLDRKMAAWAKLQARQKTF